jgi:hypothetical protein
MKTYKQYLIEARDLIADPIRWTRHHRAKDSAGKAVSPTEFDAVCFCAQGAIARVVNHDFESVYPSKERDLFRKLDNRLDIQAKALGFDHDVELNDSPLAGHAKVIEMFDMAIAAEPD